MNAQLCITLRFLQPFSHGRGDGGEPEWPPSPFRVFQSLVSAAAARWNERMLMEYAAPALKWLESLVAPEVTGSIGKISDVKCQFYVPDNTAELLVPSWSRGEMQKGVNRSEKVVRPTHLYGDGAVHYLYSLPDGKCPHFEVLQAAARSATHLGWGIDMVAGNAEILTEDQVKELKGEVWRPASDNSGTPLRVPVDGTLNALMDKHQAFLDRLSKDGFKPVPPLSTFKVVHYRRATDSASRPWCAFAILKPDASGNRAFDTARRARDVAAWVRNVTGDVCSSWKDVASFVHGHDPQDSKKQAKGEKADARFMYLPLPTIEHRGEAGIVVGSIRRVLIAAPPEYKERIDFIRRRLPGQELVWDDKPIGLLNILPTNDWVLGQYTGSSNVWSTVTPVVLPGHDDRDSAKAELLLRKAFVHAGVSQELLAAAELEWRHVGFRAGLDLAKNYGKPENLNGPTYHVRVTFPQKVRGPLAVGAGRYRGLGLFAAEGS